MEEQEVVNETPVEQTTETESTPVETETVDATEDSSSETLNEPVDNTNEIVRKRVNELKAKYESPEYIAQKAYELGLAQPVQAPQYQGAPELDEESQQAVQNYVMQSMAQAEIQKFNVKHGAELAKDPVLKAQVESHMREQAAKGQTIVPEMAYETAKNLLDQRFKPVVEEAKQKGVEEGRDIAKAKQQLGAVGQAGKQPEADPNSMSSKELAEYLKIPRIN
jgi:hypothetical protein